MKKLLLFAGTTEGRELAEYLQTKPIILYICVATEYGETLLLHNENTIISSKRLDKEEMLNLMQKEHFDAVIDATHPYAAIASKNILFACKNSNSIYLRLLREETDYNTSSDSCVYVNSVENCIHFLQKTSGNILLTTGSKDLAKFTALKNYQERIYARVLSLPDVVEECSHIGFFGKHLICMQGPFSEELNYALLKHVNASYLVTKASGSNGGFLEKIHAAYKADVIPIIITPPSKETGYTLSSLIQKLNTFF